MNFDEMMEASLKIQKFAQVRRRWLTLGNLARPLSLSNIQRAHFSHPQINSKLRRLQVISCLLKISATLL